MLTAIFAVLYLLIGAITSLMIGKRLDLTPIILWPIVLLCGIAIAIDDLVIKMIRRNRH